ncbi:hypothetical protein PybrP1_004945 [[Pythium] brassicae (nom. inval.)]|nr:hypothetical protein PybrP1_004945 [[Pythium] brassicae (nom. inval.)]
MFRPLRAATFSPSTAAVCIGSGRFVRAMLVPVLRAVGADVVVAQTRGRDFADACARASGAYEMDVFRADGSTETEVVEVEAVGSLGDVEGRAAFMELPAQLPGLKYIGFAVTDSGIVKDGQAVVDLAEFVLEATWAGKPADSAPFERYLEAKVHFHNTMVDRLTNHRPGNPLVPSTEPRPRKALVIEDLHAVLDAAAFAAQPGVHIRSRRAELAEDRLLKLCVANAVSSAMVQLMALARVNTTVHCYRDPVVRAYMDLLFETDIVPAVAVRGVSRAAAQQTYDEWMARFHHGHAGLDTFWVAQNTMFKYDVRLFCSIAASASSDPAYRPSALMVFAAAVILRYLTPVEPRPRRVLAPRGEPVFVGAMDPVAAYSYNTAKVSWVYGDSMTADLSSGEYEFTDDAGGYIARHLGAASNAWLGAAAGSDAQRSAGLRVGVAVTAALSTLRDFDLSKDVFVAFAADVADVYVKLLDVRTSASGSSLDVLKDVMHALQSRSATQ